MSYDPVEGIHYIFDRYAFINDILQDGGAQIAPLNRDSLTNQIEAAVKFARALHHTDRQARAGDKNIKHAATTTHFINDCARILLNPEFKSIYDDKLDDFRTNRPLFISTDGTALVSPGESFFDVRALLSADVIDTRDLEQRIREMTQYDDALVSRMKPIYEMMPELDDIRAIYRDALTRKLTYLELLEDTAWAKLGYSTIAPDAKAAGEFSMTHSDDYTSRVNQALAEAAERDIAPSLDQHGDLARLGMAKIPLLLKAFNGAAADIQNSGPQTLGPVLDELKTRARENFAIRAAYVRDVAQQKQSVLEELVTLTPVVALHPGKPGEIYDFYLLQPGEQGAHAVSLRMTLDTQTGQAEIAEIYPQKPLLETFKAAGFQRGSFSVLPNPEIKSMLVEIVAACERFVKKCRQPVWHDPVSPPQAGGNRVIDQGHNKPR
jgi:hypothetical protein